MAAIEINNFKSVEFMRKVRAERTKKYQTDREGYLRDLKEVMKQYQKKLK
ncbi:MAG: hypothetical protein SFW35_12585 [Chitinophagales bacterium]|nr:hypothetical protein [Chitinophagales bacterium]